MFVDYSNVFNNYDKQFKYIYGKISALVIANAAMANRISEHDRDAVHSELLMSIEKLKTREKLSPDYLEGYDGVIAEIIGTNNNETKP